MLFWFATTLFVSAALLFWVQPMIAKMILPLLGGTPAVWNTCMFFFQVTLLLGYVYAHAATRWLGVRRQALLHLCLLGSAFVVLPVSVAHLQPPPAHKNPIPWLLVCLLQIVGLPFFVVSTSAPLLQRWFSTTGHRAARDPYFLYAASNLGSMVALLGYPLLIEPRLLLRQQGRSWEAGYALLVVLVAGCALLLRRPVAPDREPDEDLSPPSGLPWARRLRWVALAFAPSSLMLGVTTYLSTDIASVPLLWAVPLGLYLLTFILAFGKMPPLIGEVVLRLLPVVLLLLGWVTLIGQEYKTTIIPLHLLAFFLAALGCHGALARGRPAPRHLTEFYLWMSVGGALGGLCNGLLAPLVFNGIFEYPVVMTIACVLLLDDAPRGRRPPWLDLVLPVAVGLGATLLTLSQIVERTRIGPLSLRPDLLRAAPLTLFLYGLPWLLGYALAARAVRLGLLAGTILFGSLFFRERNDLILHKERDFFGVLRVKEELWGDYHRLQNGTTLHGRQNLDPAHRREPLTYYHRRGPIGQVFAALTERPRDIALIGLGAGTLAAYGEPGQRLTFYEIDPAILRIASDPRLFTYLSESRAEVQVVLGDARLRLSEAAPGKYGLIIIDAFGSDAIPVHLLTREALRLYLDKLTPAGLIAVHVSNRYFTLAPVVGNLARDAGLYALLEEDGRDDSIDKEPSHWVVLARHKEHLGTLAQDERWDLLQGRRGLRLWTDDFSDPLSVFDWR